jgi:predicted DNA-binding protein (MmcQ/YjbR family)
MSWEFVATNTSSTMHIDSLRRFCLSFPHTRNNLQWGETLCFKVRGKLFALVSLDAVPPTLCFKVTPERFAELLEYEGIVPAPYLGRYKWVLLERLDVLPVSEVEDMIRQSYDLITAKAPKRRKIPRRRKKKG